MWALAQGSICLVCEQKDCSSFSDGCFSCEVFTDDYYLYWYAVGYEVFE